MIVPTLLQEAPDPILFLVHRRRDYGQCLVSLPGYLGRCNVTARWNVRAGTTGTALKSRLGLPYESGFEPVSAPRRVFERGTLCIVRMQQIPFGVVRECRSPFQSPSPAWSRALPSPKFARLWWSARMVAPYFPPPSWTPESPCSFDAREAARPWPMSSIASRWAGPAGLAASREAGPSGKFLGTGNLPRRLGAAAGDALRRRNSRAWCPPETGTTGARGSSGWTLAQNRFRQGSTYGSGSASDCGRDCSALACGSGDLKEKAAKGEPKRSQFDISLSHIPPEVEEKLWVRLREDLGHAGAASRPRSNRSRCLGSPRP